MKSPKSGFALVIALSLMAFILLLLLSITTLVQVETTNSSISKQQLLARQNAQLGAMIAIGDLQKFAGPDQRVTATADILVLPSDNPVDELSDGSVKWTGVWASNAAYNNPANTVVDADVNPRNYSPDQSAAIYPYDVSLQLASAGSTTPSARWLVSGDNVIPTDALAVDDSVVLVSVAPSALAQDPNLQESVVRAPLDDILDGASSTSGRYAYWVGDEGVKARVNLVSPFVESNSGGEAKYEAGIAQVADPSTVENRLRGGKKSFISDSSNESQWKTNNSLADRTVGYESLAMLAEIADENELSEVKDLFFHDITAHSKSVISNTKKGGLKRDLTIALQNLPTDLMGPMFPPMTSGSDKADPGGPRWEQLADHYNLHLDPSITGNSINMRSHDKSLTSDGQDAFNNRINMTPVVTKYQMVLQMFSQKKVGTPSSPITTDLAEDYDYFLGFFPLITLWNPYDRDMVTDDIALFTEFRTNVDLVENGSGNSIGLVAHQWQHIDYFDDENRSAIGFTIRGTRIPAGEAVTFTPAVNSLYSVVPSSAERIKASENVLTPGTAGDLITGFFIPAYNVITDPSVTRDQVRWSLSSGNMWTIVSCLYSEVEDAVSIPGDHKFLSMMHPGFAQIFNKNVIDVDDLVAQGVPNFDFSTFQTAITAGNPVRDYNSTFDLDSIAAVNGGGRIFGFTTSFNFPKSPIERATNFKRTHLLSQMNPRSPLMTYGNLSYLNGSDFVYRLYSGADRKSWETDTIRNYQLGIYDTQAHVGMSTDSGSKQMILYEVPAEPTLSIGDLMHANLMNVDSITNTISDGNFRWNANYQQPFNTPAYAVGNSFANIHMPLGSTHEAIENDAAVGQWVNAVYGAHYDYSYLLNDTLWDDYFFSTNLDALPNPQFPLPNSRIVKSESSYTSTEMTDEKLAAGNLMLEGGFNINSTSVAAWEAVIGSMRDIDSLGETQKNGSKLKHNYSRFIQPLVSSTDEIPSYNTDLNEIVSGFRFLSDDQVSILASNIVKEIKLRRATHGYPFLSLSEFINRSIDDDDVQSTDMRKRFTYLGVMQHAIDQSELNGKPGIDDDWNDQTGASGIWDSESNNGSTVYISDDTTLNNEGYYDPESLKSIKNRPYLEASPGAFTQADLLAKIGAFLTPRSDTFTIRAYGETEPSIGSGIGAKAYCEAVVQRVPTYCYDASSVASGNHKYDAPDALSADNLRFGRQFKIVSFRWLGEDEI